MNDLGSVTAQGDWPTMPKISPTRHPRQKTMSHPRRTSSSCIRFTAFPLLAFHLLVALLCALVAFHLTHRVCHVFSEGYACKYVTRGSLHPIWAVADAVIGGWIVGSAMRMYPLIQYLAKFVAMSVGALATGFYVTQMARGSTTQLIPAWVISSVAFTAYVLSAEEGARLLNTLIGWIASHARRRHPEPVPLYEFYEDV